MSYTIIIPARYESSRLPGKPLADLAGKPMIQRVVEAAQQSSANQVWVATDHAEVHERVLAFGGNSVMTAATHESGTDRLQEAVHNLGLAAEDVVVNLQGDEPLMPARVLDQVAANLQNNSWAALATLCEPLLETAEYLNPNVVKVVHSDDLRALYFSRAPIPALRDQDVHAMTKLPDSLYARRHVGLYAYRVRFLDDFVGWPVHALESAERLEQLRALANGAQIHITDSIAAIPPGVDTPADLEAVRRTFLQEQGRVS